MSLRGHQNLEGQLRSIKVGVCCYFDQKFMAVHFILDNLLYLYFVFCSYTHAKVREKFTKCSVDEISKNSRLSLHESMLPAEIEKFQRDVTQNIPDHSELHESQRVNTMRKKKPKNVSLSRLLNILLTLFKINNKIKLSSITSEKCSQTRTKLLYEVTVIVSLSFLSLEN